MPNKLHQLKMDGAFLRIKVAVTRRKKVVVVKPKEIKNQKKETLEKDE